MHRACLIFHYIWGIKSAVWFYLTVGSGILHRKPREKGPQDTCVSSAVRRTLWTTVYAHRIQALQNSIFEKELNNTSKGYYYTSSMMCTCTVFNIYTQNEAVTETVLLFANKCGGFLVLFCLVSLASLTVGLQCYSEQCSVRIIFLLVAVGLWLVFFCVAGAKRFLCCFVVGHSAEVPPPQPSPPPPTWFYCCAGR